MGKCVSKPTSDDSTDNNDIILIKKNITPTTTTTNKLNTINTNNINKIIPELPDFPCQHKLMPCYVYSVYDGDTVSIVYEVNSSLIKTKVRLLGIDTPEMKRGKNKHIEEKQAAIICRNYLSSLILNKRINIIMEDVDKYGRMLGYLYMDGKTKSINEILIEKNYAKQYKGKREPWTLMELNTIIEKSK